MQACTRRACRRADSARHSFPGKESKLSGMRRRTGWGVWARLLGEIARHALHASYSTQPCCRLRSRTLQNGLSLLR